MRRRFIQNKKESLWTPFYIEALEDGVSFSIGDEVEYKIDDGDWISLGKNVNSESINKGSRLYIKGQIVNSTLYENAFSIQGLCKIGGDIKSLSFREQAKKINKINDNQFQFLFENCTTIKEVLIDFHLITTLGQYCFHGMFRGCTSLVKVHNLPAVTLKEGCYMGMFFGCTNLNYIKMLATDISATNCLDHWVYGVSSTGTFVKHPDMTSLPTGINGIPGGWTVVNDGEENEGGEVKLISFTIEEGIFPPIEVEYNAIEGMTWVEWVDSEYNTGGYYIYEKDVLTPDHIRIAHPDTGRGVLTDEVIISKKYVWN